MNDWVTVAVFTYPHQAAILRSKLESEGITCYSKDENTIQANPFYSNAIGGVKIQVMPGDVIRANKIVEDYYKNMDGGDILDMEPQESYKPEEPEELTKVKIMCPNCGSDQVHLDKTPPPINIMAVLMLGLPLFFYKRNKYHCFNCGIDFKKE